MRKYATCHGRASRSEYWFFVLFGLLAGFGAGFVDGIAGLELIPGGAGPLGLLAQLALFLPSLAAYSRRLHDTDHSIWWCLLALTIIGLIPLLIWVCSKGTDGQNRFGPDPLSSPEPAET